MKRFGLVIGALCCATWLGGCSSASETREAPSTEDMPASAELTAYLIDDGGLVARRLTDGSAETVEPGIRFGGEIWHSPDRNWTAVTIEKGGSDLLSIVDRKGTYRVVHGPITNAEYTVVWAPTGDSLLIGNRSEGESGIAVFDLSSGTLTDVGCSASNRALSWGREDWFVVGDGSNQYVVEREGCATIESIDARKLHEVAFGPLGRQVAYILRELVYDREANEYRPDSSLYVADSQGLNPVLVVGDRYRPHNAAWSPDGLSLAFDARLPDDQSRRLISIFDVEEKRSAFMNPKSVDSKISEWDPEWSPSGEAIAYVQSTNGRDPLVAVRDMTGSNSRIVGKPGEVFGGWIGDRRLVVHGNGSTRLLGLDGREILTLEGPASVVTLGISTAPLETGTNGSN